MTTDRAVHAAIAPVPPRGAATGRARPARLAAYYAASFGALGIFLPFWPRWLDARGVTGAMLGLIGAVVPVMAIVAPLLAGILADALRLRGAILRIACGASCVAFAGIALAGAGPLASGIGPLGLVFLAAATAVFALARAPMVLVADVLALEEAEDSARYAALRRFGSLGFLIAALSTPLWLPLSHPWAMPAAVAGASAAAMIAAFGLPARATPLPTAARAGITAFVRMPGILPFLLSVALLNMAHAAYDLTFTLHLRDLGLPDAWVGVAWALGVAAEILLFSRAAPVVRALGHEGMLVLAAAGGAVRWALLATVTSPLLTILLQPLHAISFGCLWLAATGIVAKRASQGELGSAQGTFSACAAAGHAVGMLAWGSLRASTGGGALVFAGAAGAALLAVAPAWRVRRVR